MRRDASRHASLGSVKHSDWSEQPDGSRVRWENGIRIVDRTTRRGGPEIEHLVTWPEQGGPVIVMGLDASCRPVYITALQSSL
jgi:hypothetical protein